MSTEEKQLSNLIKLIRAATGILSPLLLGMIATLWSMNTRLAVVESELQSLREEFRSHKATMVPKGEYELFRGEISRRVAAIERPHGR